jgi:4'-phosphopantetheinyl transferase
MPLVLSDELNIDYKFSVWKRVESISFFLENMNLNPEETDQFYGLPINRVLEWLSTRYVLNMILGTNKKNVFLKDQYGKPYVYNSDTYVSLSHCDKMVAVAISDFPVGIDIENLNDKAFRIKDKFASDSDLLFKGGEEDAFYFTKLWTIKEAVYKAYGKKELIFKEQIIMRSENECSVVLNENESLDYGFNSYIYDDHILSLAWQKVHI